jgi:hypothetical protein
MIAAVSLGVLSLIGAGVAFLTFSGSSTDAIYCRPEGAAWTQDDHGNYTDTSENTFKNMIYFGLGPKSIFGAHLRSADIDTPSPALFGLPDLGHSFENHHRLKLTAAAISKGEYDEQFDNSAFEGRVYYNQTLSTTGGDAVNFGVENDDPTCIGLAANDVSAAGADCRHKYFELIVRPRSNGQNMTMFDWFNQQTYICKRHP